MSMKIPPGMIAEGLNALRRARECSAQVIWSECHMMRMTDAELEECVCDGLARSLSPLVAEASHRQESIERAEQYLDESETATAFRAAVVLMKPDDYSFLCRLLRELSREQLDIAASVPRFE